MRLCIFVWPKQALKCQHHRCPGWLQTQLVVDFVFNFIAGIVMSKKFANLNDKNKMLHFWHWPMQALSKQHTISASADSMIGCLLALLFLILSLASNGGNGHWGNASPQMPTPQGPQLAPHLVGCRLQLFCFWLAWQWAKNCNSNLWKWDVAFLHCANVSSQMPTPWVP